MAKSKQAVVADAPIDPSPNVANEAPGGPQAVVLNESIANDVLRRVNRWMANENLLEKKQLAGACEKNGSLIMVTMPNGAAYIVKIHSASKPPYAPSDVVSIMQ